MIISVPLICSCLALKDSCCLWVRAWEPGIDAEEKQVFFAVILICISSLQDFLLCSGKFQTDTHSDWQGNN